jgi:hypothetical protein
VEIADPGGNNFYHRPVIILTSDDEIACSETVVGVVASNTAANTNPRPDDYVAIPYHPAGNCGTKLKKPTVAVCHWIVKIEKCILAPDCMAGVVPPRILKEILEHVGKGTV